MKLLHTGDWHLGKKLFKHSRLDEQREFLDWIIHKIETDKIDALLMTGDLFDSPRPSDEALGLYFDFLSKFQERTSAMLYLISGNHDSGRFIEAPTPVLSADRFIVSGMLAPHNGPLCKTLKVNDEELEIVLLPYFRSIDLEQWSINHGPTDESSTLSALEALINSLPQSREGIPRLLMAHHLFGSFMPGGSEQGLYLSGLETIPLRLFKQKFDYLALGHIHAPQTLQKDSPIIHYPGSPLPFRFSEKNDKEVAIVHVEKGNVSLERIVLPIWRELVSLKANQTTLARVIQDQLEKTDFTHKFQPFWEIQCSISAPTAGLPDMARQLLDQTEIELLNFQTLLQDESENQSEAPRSRNTYSTENLFEAYYASRFPDNPEVPEKLRAAFLELLERGRRMNENS
jgi:DNA repair protein SbcD/Mre11